MNKIILPLSYNYIGVFLTLRCNLGCDYCINHFGETKQYKELSGEDWIKGLSRIQTREDLPLSLQGGEPTLHPDFYSMCLPLHIHGKHMDLLTNGMFDDKKFMQNINQDIFRRNSKYANIRFSFHANTNMMGLALKVWLLQKSEFSVGIWGLTHPDMKEKNAEMRDLCKWLGIDYREKEFLDTTYEGYKYKSAVAGLNSSNSTVMCKASELLIAPDGSIFRCHSDLYAGVNPIAHILDENVSIKEEFRPCSRYGLCNPCDIKIKTNRFQEWGHTSVEICE